MTVNRGNKFGNKQMKLLCVLFIQKLICPNFT